MAMNLSDKSIPTFESGMETDEKSFFWKIKNFSEVFKHESLINCQKIDFHAGDTVSLPSDWTIYLAYATKDDEKWIGIYLKLRNKATLNYTELLEQYHISIINPEGKTVWYSDMGVKDALTFRGWGSTKMIKDDSTLPFLIDGSLVIHVNFKIYSNSKQIPNLPVEEALQEFHTKAGAKAWSDIKGVLKNPALCTQLAKIVSSDGEEFTAQRAVLAGSNYGLPITRNPVLKAILESNMAERNSGVIHFQNISSPTLKILLDFLCLGELPRGWSHPDVIVELTHAADQYQIDDLLEFLDSMLGSVCTLENVVELLGLADQLSLYTAKEDLMLFVRQKGFESPENLVEFLKSLSVGDSSDTGPNPKKRSQAEGDTGPAGKKLKTDN